MDLLESETQKEIDISIPKCKEPAGNWMKWERLQQRWKKGPFDLTTKTHHNSAKIDINQGKQRERRREYQGMDELGKWRSSIISGLLLELIPKRTRILRPVGVVRWRWTAGVVSWASWWGRRTSGTQCVCGQLKTGWEVEEAPQSSRDMPTVTACLHGKYELWV